MSDQPSEEVTRILTDKRLGGADRAERLLPLVYDQLRAVAQPGGYTRRMQSKATTVKQYLKELPADRRAIVETVRSVILKNLDKDYEEGMQYGMIGYYVPHRVFPAGYHCDPKQGLPFAGLASQKNYVSLYMMSSVSEAEEKWFRAQWAKTGKKLDMGKCCITFKKVEDLALDVIGAAIRRNPVKAYVKQYESAMQANKATKKTTTKKTKKKTTTSARKAPSRRGA